MGYLKNKITLFTLRLMVLFSMSGHINLATECNQSAMMLMYKKNSEIQRNLYPLTDNA